MTINFYNCGSPTIQIDKVLSETPLKSITVDIPDNVDVINPVIVVDKTNIPSSANYMICGSPLDRSYFISAMDFTNSKRTIISGHVDVLSTFKAKVKAATFNFISGDSDINEVEDGSYPLGDALEVYNFRFNDWSSDFFQNNNTGQRYLLRVADGKGRPVLYPHISIGDSILYRNLLFTVSGQSAASCSLGDPTVIPLPPSEPYPSVAEGSIIIVEDSTNSAAYEFYEQYIGGGDIRYNIRLLNVD